MRNPLPSTIIAILFTHSITHLLNRPTMTHSRIQIDTLKFIHPIIGALWRICHYLYFYIIIIVLIFSFNYFFLCSLIFVWTTTTTTTTINCVIVVYLKKHNHWQSKRFLFTIFYFFDPIRKGFSFENQFISHSIQHSNIYLF